MKHIERSNKFLVRVLLSCKNQEQLRHAHNWILSLLLKKTDNNLHRTNMIMVDVYQAAMNSKLERK